MDSSTPRHEPQRQVPFVQNRDKSPHASMSADGDKAGSSQPFTINIHNPTVTYGGIDPEIEENIQFISDVSDHGLRVPGSHFGNTSKRRLSPSPFRSAKGEKPMSTVMGSAEPPCPFADLPTELIDAILAYLSPLELAKFSMTCKLINENASKDLHWRRHVLDNLPGNKVATPYPLKSWRELYAALDPHWFLPKYKIWFCDRELTGHMIIVRYDARRGCIEGYRLVVSRQAAGVEQWAANSQVHIHRFKPVVKLHLDKPVLQLNASEQRSILKLNGENGERWTSPSWREELSMQGNTADPRHSNLLLAKRLEEDDYNHLSDQCFPYGNIWPPPCIPATERVIGRPQGIHRLPSPESDSEAAFWRLEKREDMSEMTFRIRQWLELGIPPVAVAMGEEISTYSTLDPELYTPTAEKPWRGIWVGDYSGHGCEFLLVNQPEIDGESEEEPLERRTNESEEEFEQRFLRERVHRGRLEAIKLTGDPNVPRGEYTFVSDDLGPRGFVGVAEESPFAGARVVKSRGHIASEGFYHDKYMESQLILISHNRLAQHWVEFGHISYFERVDIEQFLVPK